MSKSITIVEGEQTKSFYDTAKIQTNLVGGGIQNWIPEEEAGMYIKGGEIYVTKNGTYNASSAEFEDMDAFSKVTVKVKGKYITKTITKNGTYRAKKDKADGYKTLKIEVPIDSGTSGVLIDKEVTENGTYNASDDNADGYSSVSVNVQYKGISDYYYPVTQLSDLPTSNSYSKGGAVFNGKMYAFLDDNTLYSSSGDTWQAVCSLPTGRTSRNSQLVVYNNHLYAFGIQNTSSNNTETLLFNGSSFASVGTSPSSGASNYAVYNGLVHYVGNTHYTFDGTSWNTSVAPPSSLIIGVYNNQLYGVNISNGKTYLFNGNAWSEIATIPYPSNGVFIFPQGEKLHFIGSNHYGFNGKWWRKEENITTPFCAIAYNDSIYLLCSNNKQYKATYTA